MRVPVTIVSGYLGAGKTTVINRLLQEDHGQRLAVLVNDFGNINVDANLIQHELGDSIALTNGCICCSLGDDLSFSVDRLLKREAPPEQILIEASGISDPVAIANILLNDSRLSYAGIVTVADGLNFDALMQDALLAEQVTHQLRAADLVLVTKVSAEQCRQSDLCERLTQIGARTPTVVDKIPLSQLLLDTIPLPRSKKTSAHPGYVSWHHRSTTLLDRRALGEKLASRPDGLYRMKGFILTTGGAYALHVVGRHVEAKRCEAEETALVALGPVGRVTHAEIESWWQESVAVDVSSAL